MAPVSKIAPFPFPSKKALPLALRDTLHFLLPDGFEGVMLVGGTTLAGFYAEHRRSDDLDFFAKNRECFGRFFQSIQQLKKKGIEFEGEFHTPSYFRTTAHYKKHAFTIDLVLDENLFSFESGILTHSGIRVTSLEGLLAMKMACLVSRCSEKDLFDLDWLLNHKKTFDLKELIGAGQKVDAGLNVESLLISLQGALLRKEACHFLFSPSALNITKAFRKITLLRNQLIQALLDFEKKSPVSAEIKALKDSL